MISWRTGRTIEVDLVGIFGELYALSCLSGKMDLDLDDSKQSQNHQERWTSLSYLEEPQHCHVYPVEPSECVITIAALFSGSVRHCYFHLGYWKEIQHTGRIHGKTLTNRNA